MTDINIPDNHVLEIKEFIKDGFVLREFGYISINDFIVQAIEGQLEADKDIARWKN